MVILQPAGVLLWNITTPPTPRRTFTPHKGGGGTPLWRQMQVLWVRRYSFNRSPLSVTWSAAAVSAGRPDPRRGASAWPSPLYPAPASAAWTCPLECREIYPPCPRTRTPLPWGCWASCLLLLQQHTTKGGLSQRVNTNKLKYICVLIIFGVHVDPYNTEIYFI